MYKKFNKLIFIITLATVFLVSIINFIIDPFDIFKVYKSERVNLFKSCISKQERMTKIPALKLYKDKIDIIFVGSSKIDWWLNPYYSSKISGKNVYSLAMSSSSIKENIIMAENALLIHPEIKKIYFGLDFFAFSSNYYDTAVDIKRINNIKISAEEILPFLISFDTFKYSLITLKDNILLKNNEDFYSVENTQNYRAMHYFEQTVKKYDRDYYSDYVLNTDAIEELLSFQEFAQNKGAQVVFLFTPAHIIDLINIKEHFLTDDYFRLKEKLAENFDYYDLSSINKYNTEPVSTDMKYFRDAVHATKYMGALFEQSLFVKNNDTVILINKENVKNYLKKEENKFNNYIQDHPQVIECVKEWIR